jgi:hypothetical protein
MALAIVAGCGSEEDKISLVPVKGTITMNGKPLEGATVSFVPDAGNKFNTPGVDTTGPEGNYMIRFKSRSGLSPGKYTVVVEQSVNPTFAGEMSEPMKNDPMMLQIAADAASQAGAKKKTAPAITKKEFEAQVASEKNDPFDFDVKGRSTTGASAKK